MALELGTFCGAPLIHVQQLNSQIGKLRVVKGEAVMPPFCLAFRPFVLALF